MKKSVRIEGMSCSHCVAAVRKALEDLEGVHVLDVEIGHVTVEADDTQEEAVLSAVREAGYKPISTTSS